MREINELLLMKSSNDPYLTKQKFDFTKRIDI